MNKLITFEKVELLFQQRLFLIEIEQRNQIAKSIAHHLKQVSVEPDAYS